MVDNLYKITQVSRLQVAYENHWSAPKIFQRNSHSHTLYHREDGGGERDRERNVERESNITSSFLGLETDIKYNKWGIINETLIRILALMMIFFWPLDLLKSNGLKNVLLFRVKPIVTWTHLIFILAFVNNDKWNCYLMILYATWCFGV